jgi:hypothetical protein
MDDTIPQELRFIGYVEIYTRIYIARAKELEQRDPVMNYFCLLYAAHMAIESQTKSKDSEAFLLNMIGHLEKLKKDLATNEAITNELVGCNLYILIIS